jgi:hypothetical protein
MVYKMDDQARIENVINAPPTARLPIRPAWTATATMIQLFEWNPVPPSVASTPTISWWTPGLPPQNTITPPV